MDIIVLALFGLVFGSFVGALTYRLPRDISLIKTNRSFCDKCKRSLSWHDNVPVISYVVLSGRCRSCHKKISARYPLIEIFTAGVFLVIYIFRSQILANSWLENPLYILFVLFIATLLIAIFVIDLERGIIPDELVFIGWLASLFLILITNSPLYELFLAGLIAANFLLLVNLLTIGKGMGLGDVKLALFIGTFFGILKMVFWLFSGFIIGSIVGIILLTLGKKKLSEKIAFGPFLVVAFFVTLFVGDKLINIFLALR
jgi:prepilin signal peptidase PulO-like enzyme (type II secretory pathway)